jgi:hypothetical protein
MTRRALSESDLAPARPVWARHEGDRFFHGVSSVQRGHSALTFCSGRWPTGDHVEISDSPPHNERCEACSRSMVDVRAVERGLNELAVAAPNMRLKVAMIDFDLSDIGAPDLGGES